MDPATPDMAGQHGSAGNEIQNCLVELAEFVSI